MYKLCIFAGTTEGRELAAFLTGQKLEVTACVATEYGQTLLTPGENLTIRSGRMDSAQMAAFLTENRFDLVLDATHPYAQVVTENLSAACAETGTEYLRILREDSRQEGDAVYVPDIPGAVDYLNTTEGNILLTTGSKELARYGELTGFAERVYARVLPMADSLAACQNAGLKPARIIAMQGPFSQEMNEALLRATGARFLVTKDGGSTGGFDQKALAAKVCGATLVVIGRPPQKEGLTLLDAKALLIRRFGCREIPVVDIVGIGPGDEASQTGHVRRAIREADCLIGAQRMLEVGMDKPGFAAIAPEAIAEIIHTHPEYRRFAVVMSGDTGFFSGTKKLLPLLAGCRTRVLPGLSSMSVLCARLGTSYEDVKPVSLHGREHDILTDVRREKRVFTLVGGKDGMQQLCRHLTENGLGHLRLGVGERLGYGDERITVDTAEALQDTAFAPLSVALIENDCPDAIVTHGLPDSTFQRKLGQEPVPMTKREVRSVSLSSLELTKHAVCWDIGAGTGSVSIEMALQSRGGWVYAVERKAEALALLEENRQKLGAENLTIVSGTAPEACRDLPAPSHVFIGGSAGNMHEILSLILAKNPSARIVATAIALETVAELTQCLRDFPWAQTEVVTIQAARDRLAGRYHLMTGGNPVYIFTMQGGKAE